MSLYSSSGSLSKISWLVAQRQLSCRMVFADSNDQAYDRHKKASWYDLPASHSRTILEQSSRDKTTLRRRHSSEDSDNETVVPESEMMELTKYHTSGW